MVIIRTRTEEVSIQAVSPVSIFGAGVGGGGGRARRRRGAAAVRRRRRRRRGGGGRRAPVRPRSGRDGAERRPGDRRRRGRTRPAVGIRLASSLPCSLVGWLSLRGRPSRFRRSGCARRSSTSRTKILPSPILPVAAAVLMASTAPADGGVVDHRLQLHLGHEIHLVLRAPIDFGLALLPAVALDLRHRQALRRPPPTSASRTSSSLKGLTIAMISFIACSRAVRTPFGARAFPCVDPRTANGTAFAPPCRPPDAMAARRGASTCLGIGREWRTSASAAGRDSARRPNSGQVCRVPWNSQR